MKQTIYIPVKVEEELPPIDPQYNDGFSIFSNHVTALWDGEVWVRSWYDFGAEEWEHCEDWVRGNKSPDYWLKPVEITEEEIDQMFPLEVDKVMFKASKSYNQMQKHRREGAKAILTKLNGER